MKIEHVALNVADPAALAEWYVEHLGMRIARRSEEPVCCRFLADSSGQSLLEVYRNDRAPVPAYAAADPLVLHVAFCSRDVRADRDRLVAAGATVVEDAHVLPNGDELAMLRDPWGLALQLMRRAEPMVRA